MVGLETQWTRTTFTLTIDYKRHLSNHLCPSCLQKLHWSRLNKIGVRINKKRRKYEKLQALNIISRYHKIGNVLEAFGYNQDAIWYRNIHKFVVYHHYGLHNQQTFLKWNNIHCLNSN